MTEHYFDKTYNGTPAEWIDRAFGGGFGRLREPENYGDVTLSVQASSAHYCTPRTGDASIPLEHYSAVEIALWWGDDGPRRGGWIKKPSTDLGIEGFDDLWNDDDVAAQVPLPRVGALQVALLTRQHKIEVVMKRKGWSE